MRPPLVARDDFWADLVNAFFLRAVYRVSSGGRDDLPSPEGNSVPPGIDTASPLESDGKASDENAAKETQDAENALERDELGSARTSLESALQAIDHLTSDTDTDTDKNAAKARYDDRMRLLKSKKSNMKLRP